MSENSEEMKNEQNIQENLDKVAHKHEDDSIKWRAKYKVTKDELETLRAKSESEKQDILSKHDLTVSEKKALEQKYIDAELKAQAIAAGIKDIDFVKLIDRSALQIDEKGNMIGFEQAILAQKEKKTGLVRK